MRAAKHNGMQLRKERLAESCDRNNGMDMWRELKRMNVRGMNVTHVAYTSKTIAATFARKYDLLYNSVPASDDAVNGIIELVNKEVDNDKCGKFKVDTYNIGVAVKQLNKWKRDGNAYLYSDHIQIHRLNCTHVGSAY